MGAARRNLNLTEDAFRKGQEREKEMASDRMKVAEETRKWRQEQDRLKREVSALRTDRTQLETDTNRIREQGTASWRV